MTDSIKIYHNPRCSKSRMAMQLLSDKGIKANVIEYLSTPPDKKTLQNILNMLGLQPRQLMRTHETEYKDNNLANESLNDEQLIEAMVKYPKLIERPIVVNGDKAAIGRPTENILEIL